MNLTPFPHLVIDNFFDGLEATRKELLELPDSVWDRYSNPFETKFTLRDRVNLPAETRRVFDHLISESFLSFLKNLTSYDLEVEKERNFWGVHKYFAGDKLDIHLDAEISPFTGQRKRVTVLLYASDDSVKGCNLELWRGHSGGLLEKAVEIEPKFNRLVIFDNTEVSWHGNPTPLEKGTRLLLTLSYMSENTEGKSRKKALFVKRPQDPEDAEKDRLRLLRADPNRCRDVYNMGMK